MSTHSKLILTLFALCGLLLTTACSSSSPTGPGGPTGGGPTGGGPFAGPAGYLEVDGSSAFGPRFEPGDVELMEIGPARGLQYVAGDERILMVFFETTTLQVTGVSVGVVLPTGNDFWDLDNGIGIPVDGVTVIPDGDDWILQFEHTQVPGALGTFGTLTLYGSLRSDF